MTKRTYNNVAHSRNKILAFFPSCPKVLPLFSPSSYLLTRRRWQATRPPGDDWWCSIR